MAKFLDTFGISNEIAQLIKNAKDKLYLISPYLQIDDRFKQMLEDKDRMKLDVRIIYRENKLYHRFSARIADSFIISCNRILFFFYF